MVLSVGPKFKLAKINFMEIFWVDFLYRWVTNNKELERGQIDYSR